MSPLHDPAQQTVVGANLKTRVLRGTGAQIVSQATILATQVCGVALFIRFWGPALYGEWLILFAVPSYLAISDLGFTTATANEMAMQVARRREHAARVAFATTRNLLRAVGVALPVTLTALVLALPVHHLFGLRILNHGDVALIVSALAVQVALNLYCQLYYAGFYSVGRYPEGMLLLSLGLLLEFVFVIAVLVSGKGPTYAAVGLAMARALAAGVMHIRLRATASWLCHPRPRGSKEVGRSLLRPALSSGAFPVGNLASVQGITLVLGATLGPLAVAAFSTVRTMTRSGLQVLRAVFAIAQPEVSRAFGLGDIPLLRRLHVHAFQIAIALAVPLTIVLFLVGETLFDLWTDGRIGLDRDVLALLLLVVVLNSLWYTSLSVSYATNRHGRLAIAYMVTTLSTMVISYLLALAVGPIGVAAALVAAEVIMVGCVLPATLRMLGQRPREFLVAILRIRRPRLA